MDHVIYDFTRGSAPWESVDDRVMGGASASHMAAGEGGAVFTGVVSLANNGGFASVRSPDGPIVLDGYAGIAVELCSDGKQYGLRLRTSNRLDDVAFQAPLVAPAGRWEIVRLPFAAFKPRYRGCDVIDYPALDFGTICGIGLIVADRQEGPFRLGVRRIGAWK